MLPVVVVVGLAVLAGTLRSETRDVVAYIDTTQSLLIEQAAMADAFEQLIRIEFSTVERQDFDTILARTQSGLRDARGRLADIEVPDPVVVPNELLNLALESWETGLDRFSTGVLDAADDPTSPAPVQMIEDGVLTLRLGDAVYARFLERVRKLVASVDVVVGDFPEISFATGEPTLVSASNLAEFVRTSSALSVESDLAVVSVVFDPRETGGETTDGAMVFPVTDSLLMLASVKNVGNQPETGVVVDLAMFDSGGAAVTTESSEELDLAAGEATSIQFGPVPVSPGQRYGLVISVTRTETELDVDDNRWERDLVINSP